MQLIVDANIIIALLINPGKTADAFFSDQLVIYVPDFVFSELSQQKERIASRTQLSKEALENAYNIIFHHSTIIAKEKYVHLIADADNICPDPNDVEYFAAALFLHCPIWSNDKRLKQQNKVTVLSTQEVLQLLDNQ